jgi:hypothetical protein
MICIRMKLSDGEKSAIFIIGKNYKLALEE